MTTLRKPAPAEPATRVYVSRYKRGYCLEANGHGLGGYSKTAHDDPEKRYVASSWLYAHGTPEQVETTGRYFRTPRAAKAWIIAEAVKAGFVTPDAQIVS